MEIKFHRLSKYASWPVLGALLVSLLLLLTTCTRPTTENTYIAMLPEPQAFQTIIDEKPVYLYTLDNGDGMKIAITNFGGRIVSWLAQDRNGNWDDIVMGYDSIDGYLSSNEAFFGALIGRYSNRIQKGQFTLNDSTYQLDINNGPHHLHGGSKGFHNVVWNATQHSETHLSLNYTSVDGEMGYPGTVQVQVDFRLEANNSLRIDFAATTDKATPINLTTHPFFNLGGAASGSIEDHVLTLFADYYTPIDSLLIPTGVLEPVEGTPFDFRTPTPIRRQLDSTNTQQIYGRGFDHNFVIQQTDTTESLKLAARVLERRSGRILEVLTSQPGIQFYSGNFLDGSDEGREGKPYVYRGAFCLEPQFFPDAPNRPEFPSTLLEPNERYEHTIVFRLDVKK